MCRDRVHCRTALMGGRPTVRFVAAVPPPPEGCRWCGAAKRGHGQQWVPSAGWHGWVQPTREQVAVRIRAHLRLSSARLRPDADRVCKFLP